MTRAICAASARGAPGRTSCNQPVRHAQSLETDHQQEALRCASLRFVPVKTFCTSFKAAAPRGRSGRPSAPRPSLTLPLPLRPGSAPVGWR